LLAWAACQTTHKPLERLALDLGVDARTLRRWIYGESGPPLAVAMRLERTHSIPCEAWASGDDDDDTKAR